MDGIKRRPPAHSREPRPAPALDRRPEPEPAPLPVTHRPARRRSWRKVMLGLGAGLILVFLLAAGYLVYQGKLLSEAISVEKKSSASFLAELKRFSQSFLGDERVALRGESEGRINVLLLGRAGERYPGRNLTDTVMIASLDTESRKVALLSLPRDLFVPIPQSASATKLNALYQYGLNRGEGVEPLRESVAHVTGLELHYFAMIDFDGFEKAVDALGGIEVDVARDIYDPRYPGKNYSYELFELSAGRQHLDGKTALKYVRMRHDDPEGDFGRAKRQQQAMQALRDRALAPGVLFNVFTLERLLGIVGESVKTDMTLAEMQSFFALSQTLDTKNPTTFVVDAWKKESLLRTSHIFVGEAQTRAFILVPRAGASNWSEIRDVARNIFHLEILAERERRITEEEASVALLVDAALRPTAERLRRLILEDVAVASVQVVTLPRLENPPEESIIVDRTSLEKPYSLDEFLKRFPLTRRESLDLAPLPRFTGMPDFLILVGSDMEALLDLQENTGLEAVPLDAEPLPPQPRQLP